MLLRSTTSTALIELIKKDTLISNKKSGIIFLISLLFAEETKMNPETKHKLRLFFYISYKSIMKIGNIVPYPIKLTN